ncbi:hypothetical protein ASPZODRAFT_135561 [Penicilliopsis zonata CBS 506.65]|uniref:Uncharacterized protein n=1 Tax=Penicilliopsis zonata CBS 506.65 TaxID=1073090 RepID=A0A1L9SA85_9EURO|nr:hypothetical protein ASPZODRAFT_135561 [Penicilliopsis zonata CBS 506.65]OJJ44095.1 hypothetical protein ASPZODRAFT_135561 [Penicilliopsis zonata CBS 506.65]
MDSCNGCFRAFAKGHHLQQYSIDRLVDPVGRFLFFFSLLGVSLFPIRVDVRTLPASESFQLAIQLFLQGVRVQWDRKMGIRVSLSVRVRSSRI